MIRLMTKMATSLGDLQSVVDHIKTNLTTIDTARGSNLSGLLSYVLLDFFYYNAEDHIVDDDWSGSWDAMKIYYSSFKENDVRFIYQLFDKLNQYVNVFAKIQTDNGFTKRIVTNRQYENVAGGTTTNKNVNSDTPSIEIQTFEDAIKYASNVSRNDGSDHSEQTGESTDTIEGVTYEQAVDNLNKIMLNELADYIGGMPNMVFKEYALESMPVPALYKEFREYIKTVVEVTKNAYR